MPLPSSGRTHLTVRLTVGDPASSPVSGLDMASSAACLPEIRMSTPEMGAGYQKTISHPEHCDRLFRLICNLGNISLGFALIHGPEPAVLPVARIVRY